MEFDSYAFVLLRWPPGMYATDMEEARALAQQDPKVRAGRLAVEVMTWWTEKGSVTFHRR